MRDESDYGESLRELLLLALFFACGVLAGQAAAGSLPEQTCAEFRRCVETFLKADPGAWGSWTEIAAAVLLYMRAPALALVLGVTVSGAAAVPLFSAALGFLLSFSAGCFTFSFGAAGAALSAAALGMRCLAVLPCFFLLSVSALERRAAQNGSRAETGRPLYRRMFCCGLVLLLTAAADLYCTPVLMRAITGLLLGPD